MRGSGVLTVVKLGGSQAFSPYLQDWLEAIVSCAGRVVVVPGGGPFADSVRAAQPKMGFDDRAAHHMALLAMEQYGCALASLHGRWTIVASIKGIRHVLRARRVPVWAPVRMVLGAKDVPASWDVTSDSLAVWLASKLGAKRLLLVKHVNGPARTLHAHDIVATGLVDPLFTHFLAESDVSVSLVGAADHAAVTAAVHGEPQPGAIIAGVN